MAYLAIPTPGDLQRILDPSLKIASWDFFAFCDKGTILVVFISKIAHIMNIAHLESISGLFIIDPREGKEERKKNFSSLSREHIINTKSGSSTVAKNFDIHLYG